MPESEIQRCMLQTIRVCDTANRLKDWLGAPSRYKGEPTLEETGDFIVTAFNELQAYQNEVKGLANCGLDTSAVNQVTEKIEKRILELRPITDIKTLQTFGIMAQMDVAKAERTLRQIIETSMDAHSRGR